MFQTVLRLQWIKRTKIVSILLSISPLLDYKIKLEQNTKSEQENSRCEHFYNLPCLNKNIICFIIYNTTIYSKNPKIKLSITSPDHWFEGHFVLLFYKSVVIINTFLVIICQIVRAWNQLCTCVCNGTANLKCPLSDRWSDGKNWFGMPSYGSIASLGTVSRAAVALRLAESNQI